MSKELEIESTDLEVARLIANQTYTDRMDMARWFSAAVQWWLSDQESGYVLTDADFADWFQQWALEVLTDE